LLPQIEQTSESTTTVVVVAVDSDVASKLSASDTGFVDPTQSAHRGRAVRLWAIHEAPHSPQTRAIPADDRCSATVSGVQLWRASTKPEYGATGIPF
jgi:hypothetical protein